MVLVKKSRLRVESLDERSLPSATFVLDWNELLVNVAQQRAQGNQQSARALAMMNSAVYDSVNAINPTHTVYHVDARAFPDVSTASADAAAAQAAHDVAVRLYTNPADVQAFDTLRDNQLGTIPDGPAEDAGVALGAVRRRPDRDMAVARTGPRHRCPTSTTSSRASGGRPRQRSPRRPPPRNGDSSPRSRWRAATSSVRVRPPR